MIDRTKQTESTLAEKTTAILSNAKASSNDIEHLSMETETELALAQRNLERENVSALNPNLDAEKALQAIKHAELQVARLSNSLRLLQQEHGIALAREYKDRFYARQHKAQPIRDAASDRFRRIEALQQEMVDIYNEALEADALVAEANSDAPVGEANRLLKTEEHARGLEDGFSRSRPSLIKETVLYDFNTGEQIWPPRTSVGAAYAAMMAPADHRHYPGDASSQWWMRGQQVEEARAKREQEQLVQRDDFYNGQTR